MPEKPDDHEKEMRSVTPRPAPFATSGVNADPLFSSFSNRMVCTVFELFVALLVNEFVIYAMLSPHGWQYTDTRPFAFVFLFVYFAGFWASPLCATPVQFVWGSRVVDAEGRSLALWRATVRSALVVGLIAGALRIFETPSGSVMGVIAATSYVLLFLAALTRNRQAAHDFLVRSFVVRRAAVKSAQGLDRLRKATSNRESDSPPTGRPKIGSIVWDALVLGLPLFAVSASINVYHDMNIRYRVSYATGETNALKSAIETFHVEYGRPPTNAGELGMGRSVFYPEGGYYHLERDGWIRIRFTVKPELKHGSIVLTPSFNDDGVTWACAAEGDLEQRYLPSSCR